MLIIFGGLPGVGKSTIARNLAFTLNAIYLRIDTIETAMMVSQLQIKKAEDAGYWVAYEIAKDNLAIGHTVIADSVNPIAITRHAWQDVARSRDRKFIEVEVMCSNKIEHQHRIETRIADIKDQVLPTWKEVIEREYEVWGNVGIRLDTASYSVEECVDQILNFIRHKNL